MVSKSKEELSEKCRKNEEERREIFRNLPQPKSMHLIPYLPNPIPHPKKPEPEVQNFLSLL